jgi:predicted HAD superfamily Cof-like phosphohydrolase
MFLRVAEFHRAFGHPVAATPELPEQAVRDLRIKLIREELNEYCTAFENNDRVEMADALADLLYVLAGTAVSYGFAPDEPIESPYDGRDPIEGRSGAYAQFLRDDFAKYEAAEQSNDIDLIRSAVFHMMVEIFGIARQSRIPINAVFTEVHRSNLTKLDENGRVVTRDDGKVMKSDRYQPPAVAEIIEAWDSQLV